MNVLNVNYKDKIVSINYFSINIDKDDTQIYFINTQNNDCKSSVNILMLIELIMKKKKEIVIL